MVAERTATLTATDYEEKATVSSTVKKGAYGKEL